MKTLLSLILVSFLLLSGCSSLETILGGDTEIETKSGKKYSCVTNLKTCIKTCEVDSAGLKVKKSILLPTDICTVSE